jgi:hypothetical protein
VSSKPQRAASNKQTEEIPTAAELSEAQVDNWTRDEEIRRRAYEIHLEHGEQHGRALDDWLEAERGLEEQSFRA